MSQIEALRLSVKDRIYLWLHHSKEIKYSTVRGARRAVVDFLVYVIFVALASVVTQMNNTKNMYYYNNALKRLLVERAINFEDDPNGKFENINNIDRFWDYILDVFLNILEKGDFRPNDPAAIYTFPNDTTFYNEIYGNMVERNIYHGNVLLGPPRLRQICVRDGLCSTNPVFSKNSPTCYAPYSWSGESRANHQGYQWVSMAQDGATPINGILDWYFGAGFIQMLTYNYRDNVEIIKNLRVNEWFSRNTRIVIIEFNIYHIMTDLLEIVKLRFEQPSFGGIFPSATFTALRRHSIFTTSDKTLQAVACCYFLMVIMYTVREIAIILRIGFKKYIHSFYNFTDFTSYLLSFMSLVMQVVYHFYIESIMQKKKQTDQYISLDWACFMGNVATYINGIAIFMIWIRMLTFLIINRTMTVFKKVLLRSVNELIGFTVVLLIIIMAYAECGLVLFGVNDAKFCSLSNSLISIMSLAASKFAYEEITDKNKVITRIYYISFVLLVYVLLVLHACLSILLAAYDEVSATVKTRKSKLIVVFRMFFISLYDLLYLVFCRKRKFRQKVDVDEEGEWEVDHHFIPQMVSSLTAKRKHPIKNPVTLTPDMYLPLRMKRVSKRLIILESVILPVLKRLLKYYSQLRKEHGLNEILFEQLDLTI
ncbi:polycystic kidney disease 2-like 2 protein [Drosophila mojavensis]|uniref:Uncharacterized protein n=2 Tax=Drosophila mojavensis TaxID=7230 RepID=B4KL01_DROMO|nr:polycystic kidney disease 2-like 2 protein [Drosophila mojavensis]EDW12751.2 uncharacterized protein Dmoj_GI17846 [Drosophila mojavensis]